MNALVTSSLEAEGYSASTLSTRYIHTRFRAAKRESGIAPDVALDVILYNILLKLVMHLIDNNKTFNRHSDRR